MKLLIIDNYDSFTYNLVHIIEQTGIEFDIIRNDYTIEPDFSEYQKIILSPGPGIPKESGNLMKVIEKIYPEKCILGVCLGHQALAQFFGATLENMENVLHGVATNCKIISTDVLFDGLPNSFEVGRYHSWTVSRKEFPSCLEITAVDDNNQIMAFRHVKYKIRGVQFHPESVMTPFGKMIIFNWLQKS